MIDSLNLLINQLSTELSNSKKLIDVQYCLEEYNGDDWQQYIKFDDEKYHRQLIYHSDSFDLVIICWKYQQKSQIHDHPDQGCLMKILNGKLLENTYNNDKQLTYLSSIILEKDAIGYKTGNCILHDIHCLEDTVSLHIYSPGGYQAHYYLNENSLQK